MINENILSLAKSHVNSDPSYIILINDINQKTECNQESIIFTLHQVDLQKGKTKFIQEIMQEYPIMNQTHLKNVTNEVFDYIFNDENGYLTKRNLHIISDLSSDEDGFYHSKLIGYLADEERKKISNYEYNSNTQEVLAHYIEIIETNLKEEIDIIFQKSYKNTPKIIINIEEKYESLYKGFSLDFDSHNEYGYNEETGELNFYPGVTIRFNNLKLKSVYPKVSIIIIGDIKEDDEEETEEEES